MKRFGVSTHLYHGERLKQDHLLEVAAHGFDAIEVFATRSHFDYHDAGSIRSLREWLHHSGLELHSVHAPITDSLVNDQWGRIYSTATRNDAARRAAIHEVEAALGIATEIRFKFLVVHLGVPVAQNPAADDNNLDAVIRSIEEIHRMTEPLGIQVALEVMGNDLSTPWALMNILDQATDGATLGVCMDVGHAHLLGDTAEAIETTSEYLVTTHIHDNQRRRDDHLVPFEGSINWPAAVMAFEKIGYDGILMYEVKNADGSERVLARAVDARRRLERLMLDSSQLPASSSQ